MSTFKQTVDELAEGSIAVIFPEKDESYNGVLWQFRDRSVDVGRLYKKTGKKLCFVPVYLAPNLKQMHFWRACLVLGSLWRSSTLGSAVM